MSFVERLKRDKETSKKLLLTFAILFLILIGYRIPLPGVNTEYLKTLFAVMKGSGIGVFLNSLTGNSLEQMSIFALSIAPYISASIIIQLLAVFVPPIEAMQKDGSIGQKKIEKLTYIAAFILAIIQSLGMAIGFGKQGLFVTYTPWMVAYSTIVWTCGACFLTWIGQTITNKLIGNGISMILMFNILTTFPTDLIYIFQSVSHDKALETKIAIGLLMAVVIVLAFAYVVVMNSAEKKIKIKNSNQAGSYINGAQNNDLPLKINMGGVMPIIFSTSVMAVPVLIANFAKLDSESIWYKIAMCFNQGMWFNPDRPIYTLGILAFIPITCFFAYFYSLISFNTDEIANNMKKSGSVIPGIRPGQATSDYLKSNMRSVLVVGTGMLILIALLPTIISGLFHIQGLSFGGTTIIIIVGVIMELKETILARTSTTTYKSLLKRKGKR